MVGAQGARSFLVYLDVDGIVVDPGTLAAFGVGASLGS